MTRNIMRLAVPLVVASGALAGFAAWAQTASQTALGIDPTDTQSLRKAGKTPLQRELVEARIAELKSRIAAGGVHEGAIRALIYVQLGARAAVDERGFEVIRRMREIKDHVHRPTLAEFKAMVRDQTLLLLLEPEAAVAALPDLIPDAEARRWPARLTRHRGY